MVNFQCKSFYDMDDLLTIIKLLRGPGGCPWDQQQNHASIRRNFLEETYEAVEAIDRNDKDSLCEELGDVLMQVVFHATMEEEQGRFAMSDVVNGVCQKLVYRHPHVFGTVEVSDTSEVLSNWEALKRKEKGQASTADAVDAVAKTLPALWRAEKMQKKASKSGFDWSEVSSAIKKLEEEVSELRDAVVLNEPADAPHGVKEELGDVLFIATKVAQMSGVDPEEALHAACDKFSQRFRVVDEGLEQVPPEQRNKDDMLRLWKQAKEHHHT